MKHYMYLPMLLVSPFAHAGADCQPVYAAMQKLAITPVHEYMQETAAFKKAPSNSEVVITSTATYVKVAGQWKAMAYDPKKQAQAIAATATMQHTTCARRPDENVSGDAANVYAMHEVQEGGTTVDGVLWISKTHGVPLRQAINMDVGGKFGKSHTDLRFDYANVHAPIGGK